MSLETRGTISGTVGKNSILLNATVTWANHTCIVTPDELCLNQFRGLVLRVTGLGFKNWLFSKIYTWLLQHFKSEVKDQIEYTLREEVETYLSHFNCSAYFPEL
jgi:hypothetical protein